MRADQDGRIPVKAFAFLVRGGLGLDVNPFAGNAIVADQVAFLPLGVNDVRVGRVDRWLMAVGKQRDEPVTVANPVDVVRAGRAALGAVVLRAAVNVVERRIVVNGHFVELGYRQVGKKPVGFSKIERLVKPAVGAEHHVFRIGRVKGHGMVVAVLVTVRLSDKGLAAVLADVQRRVHLVDAVELVRTGEDFLVIMGPGAAGQVIAAFLPTLATVCRAPETALTAAEFDGGIHHIGIYR